MGRGTKAGGYREPRIIGLDDWAYKRRLRYGTLICDLERKQPIDLLPDRAVETVKTWLEKHPSIEMVSRDGSAEYASAMTKGAPQARQVSDRWHVIKNLAACVSVQLAQSLADLRRAEQATARAEKKEEGQASEERRPARTRAVQHAQLARQAERTARYEQIMALQKQGVRQAEIALHLGVTQHTVQRWIALETIPYGGKARITAKIAHSVLQCYFRDAELRITFMSGISTVVEIPLMRKKQTVKTLHSFLRTSVDRFLASF